MGRLVETENSGITAGLQMAAVAKQSVAGVTSAGRLQAGTLQGRRRPHQRARHCWLVRPFSSLLMRDQPVPYCWYSATSRASSSGRHESWGERVDRWLGCDRELHVASL